MVNYTRFKRGPRKDLNGLSVRSSWEANYCRYLNYLIDVEKRELSWEFEPDTFWFEGIKRGTVSYLPDFKITSPDGSFFYVEIKGWMDKKSKTKLKRMRIYHPTIHVELVGAKQYKAIQKAYSHLIEHWEF